MNKKIASSLLIATTILASCDYNERNFEGLIEGGMPTDLKQLEYTLTAEDYAAVGSNAANKKIANGSSKEDSLALTKLKTTQLFTATITAETYLPAFLWDKYFTADNGTAVKVTYNKQSALPEYITQLNTATIYTLVAADYQAAWGATGTYNFFTPSKPAATYLPAILAAKVANPVSGKIVCASYNASEVETTSSSSATLTNTLYTYNGTAWVAYTRANVLMLGLADFKTMGGQYDNFSASMSPDTYLPIFLKLKYPYVQEGDVKAAVYKFYNSSTRLTAIVADEYSYKNGQFVKNRAVDVVTDQFVRSEGIWKFDPSVVVNLPAVRGNAEVSRFYQIITDYVKAEKGAQYVTSYGNNDYYYGGSAYNNNFDFRPSAWKGQVSTEYSSKSDAELTELMFSRLPEAFLPALQTIYTDAKPVTGVEVTFTINFSIYDGSSTTPYVIKYLVTGNGTFEYIKDSLAKVS